MTVPFLLVLTHFVSDFVLQSEWQANNKSKNIYALASHVGTYTLGLLGFILLTCTSFHYFVAGLLWVLVNGGLHFLTDYYTAPINTDLITLAKETGKYHNFFVNVGMDQVIHYGCLFYSYQWMFL